jgi:hypothetical protein
MPPKVHITPGVLVRDDRVQNIHPEVWDSDLTRYFPLDQFPLQMYFDKVPSGPPVGDVVLHWWEKPFNTLTGEIGGIFTDTALSTAKSGNTSVGETLYIKPTTDDIVKVYNVRAGDQIEIWNSTNTTKIVGIVTAVYPGGSNAHFVITVIDGAVAINGGTSPKIYWTVLGRTEEEVHELPEGLAEHETEYSNFVQTMTEAHEISLLEYTVDSRIMEDKKKERELESLIRLYQRKEAACLDGIKYKAGSRYYAGGIRYFVSQYAPANIINWKTDTTFSSPTDNPVPDTLMFIARVMQYLRTWDNPTQRKVMITSAYVRSLLNECVYNIPGRFYEISYETNRWGMPNILTLRGLDQELEIWEEPLFNVNEARKRCAYIINPENIQRRYLKNGELRQIPWSEPANQDGATYTTAMKGGWTVSETYKIVKPNSFAILENLGLAK